ncbi:DsbA family protein [Aquamicrobium ahrensii]|uniref:Protein-disulfide isomerase n=1 Tax=Aquamicrobium ahrensii TaxID=469551 RepID=A0ABV2KJD3_9HYPH
MKKTVLLGASALGLALLAAGYVAGDRDVAMTTRAQAETLDRTAIENIVREYLLANPEILLEAQDALEAKQQEQQRLVHLDTIKQNKDAIFNSSFDGVVGNPDGKITIVEFYDYNCGYCKRAMDDMDALTKADPELRFVLKEFPILSADSQKASIVSMAFHLMQPEKYGEFHRALMATEGRATEDEAIRIAVSLGADEAELREKMKDPSIPQALSATYELATKLSVTGTPSYVVGEEVVFGALGKEVLAGKIAAAREAL